MYSVCHLVPSLSTAVTVHFRAGRAGRRAEGVGQRRRGGREAGAVPEQVGGGSGEDAADRGAGGLGPGPQAVGRAAVPHEGHRRGQGSALQEAEVGTLRKQG